MQGRDMHAVLNQLTAGDIVYPHPLSHDICQAMEVKPL